MLMSCVYKKQNFEEKNALILKKFKELRDKAPEKLKENGSDRKSVV